MLSEKVSQKRPLKHLILFYISIPETSKIGSRKSHLSCLEIAETKGFSMILRIPKICGREMEAKPVFSGAKSALSIQNDQKTHSLKLSRLVYSLECSFLEFSEDFNGFDTHLESQTPLVLILVEQLSFPWCKST